MRIFAWREKERPTVKGQAARCATRTNTETLAMNGAKREERSVRERKPTVQFTATGSVIRKGSDSDRSGRRQSSEKRGAGYKLSAEEEGDDDDEESGRKGQATKKPWSQEEDEMVSRWVTRTQQTPSIRGPISSGAPLARARIRCRTPLCPFWAPGAHRMGPRPVGPGSPVAPHVMFVAAERHFLVEGIWDPEVLPSFLADSSQNSAFNAGDTSHPLCAAALASK